MVGIVGGNSTGLSQATLSGIGQRGNIGQSSQGAKGEKAFVNVSTGNLVLQDRDAFVEGRGLDISLLRTYNSQTAANDDNGDAWWINGYRRIVNLSGNLNTAGSSVQRIGHDNSVLTYTYDVTTQRYQAQNGSGEFDTIEFRDGSATWTDASGQNKESYEVDGNQWRLKSATDVNGDSLAFAYNGSFLSSITTANGEALEFVYEGNKLVQERTRQADGTYLSHTSYSYDAQNRLAQVTTDLSPENNSVADGRVYVTTYTYVGNSNLLAQVQQSDGNVTKFTYENVGGVDRVKTIKDALGRVTSFDYNVATRTTTITDAFGNQNVYVYDAQNRFLSVSGPATEGAVASDPKALINGNNSVRATEIYTYNAAGKIETVTNAIGVVTTYSYNSHGQLTGLSDTAGNRSSFTYNANLDLETSTVYRQGMAAETTRHIYDANHHERFQISAQGRVQSFEYNGLGQRIRSMSYPQAGYNLTGLSDTAVPSLSQMTAWHASQNLAQSQLVEYGYNLRGQLKTVTAFSKVDASGKGVNDGTQSVTSYSYDVQGNLLQKVDAAHQQSSMVYGNYSYDGLNRMLTSSNALGQTEIYQYDDAHHTSTVTQMNGRVDTKVYDAAGQLISTMAGGIVQTRYRYDALGRLGMSIDPTGVKHFNVYDAAGNLRAEIDGNGRVVSYSYNALGQKIQTRISAQAATQEQLNDLAAQYEAGMTSAADMPGINLIPADGIQDLVTYSLYDDAGRLAYSLSAFNASNQFGVTGYQYDGAGNLVATTQYATPFGVAGQTKHIPNTLRARDLVMPTSDLDRTSLSYYDRDNRLVGQVDPSGYVTSYRYDQAGQKTEVIRYSGMALGAKPSTDWTSFMASFAGGDEQHSYVYYDGQGRQIGTIDAERYATRYVYDTNGRVVSTTRYATPVTALVLNGQDFETICPQADNLKDQTNSTHYNDLGQIDYKINAEGTKTQYVYNEMGQLITTMTAAGTEDLRMETQRYDALGRVTTSLSGEGSVALAMATTPDEMTAVWVKYGTSYVYDAAGRRMSSTNAAGQKTLSYYDQFGNLSYSINAEREVVAFTYELRTNKVESKRVFANRLSSLVGMEGGFADETIQTKINAIVDDAKDSFTQYAYNTGDGLVSGVATRQEPNKISNTLTVRNVFGEETTTAQDTDFEGHQSIVTKKTNSRGLVTDIILNQFGTNQVTHYDYDAFGRVSSKVDPNGNRTDYVYDKLGQTIEVSDPAVDKTIGVNVTKYDAFGRVLTQTDALKHSTSYVYNKADRSVTTTTQEGVSVTTKFTRNGQTQSVIDGNGVATSYQYDKNGNVSITTKAGVTTQANYNELNQLEETVDANGNRIELKYDAVGRLLFRNVIMENARILQTKYEYDAKGLQYRVTDPNGNITQFEYDLKGQLKKQIVDAKAGGLNLTTLFDYDARGNNVEVTKPNGVVTRYKYDQSGRREQEIQDLNGAKNTTRYEYDQNNNVISMLDANGKTTRYAYDADNRAVAVIDPAGSVTTTTYDVVGRVSATRTYAAQVSEATLITLGNKPSSSQMQAVVDALAKDDAHDQTEVRVYDNDNRLLATITGGGRVTRLAYDKVGNVLERLTYAKALTSSQLQQLKANNWKLSDVTAVADSLRDLTHDSLARQSYDSFNRVNYNMNAVGAVTRFIYDDNGNLIKQVQYAKPIAPTTLAKDIAGAVTNDSNDKVSLFIYDAANRQIYQVAPNGLVTQKIYDEVGNVKEEVQFATALPAPTIDTNYALSRVGLSSKDSAAVQNAKLAVAAATDNVQRMLAPPANTNAVTLAQANLNAANAALAAAIATRSSTNAAFVQASDRVAQGEQAVFVASNALTASSQALTQAQQAKDQAQAAYDNAIAANSAAQNDRDHLAACQSAKNSADANLVTALAQHDKAAADLADAQSKLVDAQAKLAQSTDAMVDARDRKNMAEQRVQIGQAVLDALQNEVAAAQTALNSANAQLASIQQAELVAKQQKDDGAASFLAAQNTVASNLNIKNLTETELNRLRALDHNVSAASDALAAATRDSDSASAALQSAVTRKAQAADLLEKAEADLLLAQQALTVAKQNRDNASAKRDAVVAAHGKVDTAQQLVASETTKAGIAEQALLSATAQRDQATAQVADAQQAITLAQGRITSASQAKSDAEAALTAAKNKAATDLAALSASQETAQTNANTAAAELATASSKLDTANTNATTAIAAQTAAQDAVTLATKAKSDADAALAKTTADQTTRANLIKSQTTAQTNLNSATTALNAATAAVATAKTAMNSATTTRDAKAAAQVNAQNAVNTATAEKAAADAAYAKATPANRAKLLAAVNAANTKLANAKKALTAANTALANANTALNTATTTYNTKVAAETQAKATLASTTTAKNNIDASIAALGASGTTADINAKKAAVTTASNNLTSANTKLTAAKADVTAKNAALASATTVYNAAKKKSDDANLILENANKELSDATASSNATIVSLTQALSTLQTTLDQANADLNSAQTSLVSAQSEQVVALSAFNTANLENTNAQAILQSAVLALNTTKQDPNSGISIETVDAALADAESNLRNAEHNATVISQNVVDLQANLTALIVEVQSLDLAQQHALAALNTAQQNADTVGGNQQAFVNAQAAFDQAASEWQGSVANADLLSTKLQEATDRLVSAQTSLASAQTAATKAQSDFDYIAAQLAKAQSDLVTANKIVVDTKAAFQVTMAAFNDAGAQVDTLIANNTRLQSAEASAAAALTVAQIAADVARAALDTAATASAVSASYEVTADAVSTLTNKLTTENQQLDVAVAALAGAQRNIDSSNADLDKAKASAIAAKAAADAASLAVSSANVNVGAMQSQLSSAIDAAGPSAAVISAKASLSQAQQNLSSAQAAQQVLAGPPPATGAANFNVESNESIDRKTQFEYDAANRLILTTDAEKASTATVYDDKNNIVTTRQFQSGKTNSIGDRLSQVVRDATAQTEYVVYADGRVVRNNYDALGQLKITTEFAQKTVSDGTHTLSTLNALSSSPQDRVTSYEYTNDGRLKSKTDATGTESYEYNGLGQKTSFTNKANATWNYEYDAAGRLAKETSPLVYVTSAIGDDNVALTVNAGSTSKQGIVTLYRYDTFGNLQEKTEAAGLTETRTTKYEYDALGHQIKVMYPQADVYNSAADTLATTDNVGRSELQGIASPPIYTQTYYDSLGNAIANRDVGGNFSYKTYDKLGRVAFEVDAEGYVTGYGRDINGQVTTVTRYANRSKMASPATTDTASLLSVAQAMINAAVNSSDHSQDRQLVTVYDKAGRVLETREPSTVTFNSATSTAEIAGKVTVNHYNSFGEVDSIKVQKDVGGVRTTIAETRYYFDARGLQIASVDAMGYLTTQEYDAVGNLKRRVEYSTALTPVQVQNNVIVQTSTKAEDRATSYTYDALNRVKTETKENQTYTTVDAQGVRTVVNGANLTTTYDYDALGNQTFVQDAAGGITRSLYDALGRVTQTLLPGSGADNGKHLLTHYRRDAYGNVVAKIDVNFAGSDVDKDLAINYVNSQGQSHHGYTLRQERSRAANDECEWL